LLAETTEYVNLFSSSRPTDSQLARYHENQGKRQPQILNPNSNT